MAAPHKSFLHLCTQDWGGAGVATLRLHEAMRSAGLDSTVCVRERKKDVTGVIAVGRSRAAYLGEKILHTAIRHAVFRDKYFAVSAVAKSNRGLVREMLASCPRPDVLVLHWIANFLSMRDVGELKRQWRCKVVWYVLDMAPFTGGCHYAWGCEGYRDACGDCAATRSKVLDFVPKRALAEKRRVFADSDIALIAPNRWLRAQIERSPLAGQGPVPLAYIPISADVFRPRGAKSAAAGEAKRIFYGCANLSHPRKGAPEFFEALALLDRRIRAAGESAPPAPVVVLPGEPTPLPVDGLFRVEWLAPVASDEELAQLYDTVDVFVNTSVEDSGPLMIPEAMMTGVPVISFDMGIAGELIQNAENGFIVPLGDVESLASALFEFLRKSDAERDDMGTAARSTVAGMMDGRETLATFVNA